LEEFVRTIARRKVEALAFKSFSEVVRFFEDRFKVTLFGPAHLVVVTEAVETRNIIAHNRAIINERYLKRTDLPAARLGTLRDVKVGDLKGLDTLLLATV